MLQLPQEGDLRRCRPALARDRPVPPLHDACEVPSANLPLMDGLFHQVLMLRKEVGIVNLGQLGLDGPRYAPMPQITSRRASGAERKRTNSVGRPRRFSWGPRTSLRRRRASKVRRIPCSPTSARLEGAAEEGEGGAHDPRGEGRAKREGIARAHRSVQLHRYRISDRSGQRELVARPRKMAGPIGA